MNKIARRGILGLAVLAASASTALAANPQPAGVKFSVSSDDSGRLAPVAQCSANGISLTVVNDTSSDVTVLQFVDKLYSGFHYVAGSAMLTDTVAGTSTAVDDPNIQTSAGGTETLQFPDTVTVPANDAVTLHFDIKVLDRSDSKVKAPNKGSYPNHGVVTYGGELAGTKIGQNTSIRVSKTDATPCAPVAF